MASMLPIFMQLSVFISLIAVASVHGDDDYTSHEGHVDAEASGTTINIACARHTYIVIGEAYYGANCGAKNDRTDRTADLAVICTSHESCSYVIDHTKIGDPWFGCAKDYDYKWECTDHDPSQIRVREEASGQTVSMDCGWKQIHVLAAVYGVPCKVQGAYSVNWGDIQFAEYYGGTTQTNNLRDACEGKTSCDYRIDHTIIGDPAPGCAKQYLLWRLCYGETPAPSRSPTVPTDVPTAAPTTEPVAAPSAAPTRCQGFWREECLSHETGTAQRHDGQKCCRVLVGFAQQDPFGDNLLLNEPPATSKLLSLPWCIVISAFTLGLFAWTVINIRNCYLMHNKNGDAWY